MNSCSRICVVLLLVTRISTSQISDENSCDLKLTCSECIQVYACTWCMKPLMDSKPRCFDSSSTYCEKEYQWNPRSEHQLLSKRQLTRVGSAASSKNGDDIVQIRPQSMDLKLAINEYYRINWQYTEVKEYELDVYFLVDLSKSMKSDIEKLLKLGDLLAHAIPNITSKFRLGLGSFMDKNVEQNHVGDNSIYDDAYEFKNHMSLSTNATRFIEELHKIAVFNNSVVAYGAGLEAIMQSIVCNDEVGWRENARRMLIFSTNTGFHYAKDGVLPPNNSKCMVQHNSRYYPRYANSKSSPDSIIHDYPSIAQINYIVTEHKINVIFAVTTSQTSVYENLSSQVAGSAFAILGEDSSNVVNLVRNEYNKITSSVEMNDNSTIVNITYSSLVTGQFDAVVSKRRDRLKTGDVVNFNADIIVTSCPKDERDWKQIFTIYAVGIRQSLIVNLEMLCSCPCANDSAICESPLDCRPHDYAVVDCSSRGTCVRGICECKKRRNRDEVISGRYCECDNYSCERNNGLLCSDHGTCSCGVCQCQPGWSGVACDCRKGNETCILRNGEICSGHGICECGTCKCDATKDGRFSGRFCEKCPTCLDRCEELKNCVQCQIYKTGPLSTTEGICAKNCTNIVATEVDILEADQGKDEHLCSFYDDDKCRFQFVYTNTYSGCYELKVRTQKERECPQMLNNQNELSYWTAQMLLHKEEYNMRLFRKGILERGLESGIMIGNFKKLDNSYMKQVFTSTSDNAVFLADLVSRKTDDMKNELKRLKIEMDALGKTMGNVTLEVKSKTSKKIYEKWTEAINGTAIKFQKLFSKNNEVVYKMSENYEKTFSSIMNDIERKYRNICELYQNNKKRKERQGKSNNNGDFGNSWKNRPDYEVATDYENNHDVDY